VNPASIGGVLTYSGTVSNAGNITLTNVTVTNDRSGATLVFTAATLAPGAFASFTGSYTVPTNSVCSITSTLTGSGYNPCTGLRVTASASSTCPLLTAPCITVTQTCPVNLVPPGGILTYSGTVINCGNVTLTNVVVVNNQPASNTVIFTVATLGRPPGPTSPAAIGVPLNCCESSSTVGATGRDICTGHRRGHLHGYLPSAHDAADCRDQSCPPTAVRTGQLLEYSAPVSNAGNITWPR
jgi:uncharacterized repeat protein (TIGR01451 family)